MLIKDNETELYHSGIYLGKDYSDGIKHWKYIKKERKNGHWVYYYDGSLDRQRDIKKGEFEYGISKDGRKTMKKGYTYTNPYTGQKFDYKHYRKAFANDYTDYRKLDNQIKLNKATANVLNLFEKFKNRLNSALNTKTSAGKNGKNTVMNLFKKQKLYLEKANAKKEVSNKIKDNFK